MKTVAWQSESILKSQVEFKCLVVTINNLQDALLIQVDA